MICIICVRCGCFCCAGGWSRASQVQRAPTYAIKQDGEVRGIARRIEEGGWGAGGGRGRVNSLSCMAVVV